MSAGLLTGAEPTKEAYDACLLANAEYAEATDPVLISKRQAWATRDLDRLQFDGSFGSRI